MFNAMRITKKISCEVKIGVTCFFILFFSYMYFNQPYKNWNVVSRMSLTLSLVEDGTITINKFHKYAGLDKAMYKGNYYSDKAPGLSFTAMPCVAVGRVLLRIYGNHQDWMSKGVNRKFGFIVYFSTIFTSGLFTAIAALLLYFVSLRIGASISGAVFAMLSFGLASPAWGWATAFFGHAMASSCLFIAFVAIIYLDQSSLNKRRDALLGFLTGALLLWAVVVEYTAAIASVIIIFFGIANAIQWDKKKAARVVISAIIGGIIFIIPLLYYNFMAFDSPFAIGYNYYEKGAFSEMKEGLFGITYPRPGVLFMILFSPYRGILWFSPILVITPIGIYYLLLNSAFVNWHAGWSTGSRYAISMVPFVCLPLSIIWTKVGPKGKSGLLGLFTLSLGVSIICVSVSMMSPNKYPNPLFDFLIPRFLDGKLNSILNKLGITGPVTLIPILAFWAISGIFILKFWVNRGCRR